MHMYMYTYSCMHIAGIRVQIQTPPTDAQILQAPPCTCMTRPAPLSITRP